MSLEETMLDTILEDRDVTRSDLYEILQKSLDLGVEQAITDFYNDNEFPAIEDEDIAYREYKDK